MTLQDCTAILTPLALALRADIDDPTFRAYHRLLKDVPASLLEAAIEEVGGRGITFFPTAPELRAMAERHRRRVLAAHPYTGCADCEDQKGYRTLVGDMGQKTVQRCPCVARHRERLEQMGLSAPIAQLPGEEGAGDERAYPTLEQLPAALRDKVTLVAGQKVMR